MSVYLAHHGIKGQKWGVRRYQNPDGTLTDAGKKRYIRQQVSAVGVPTGAFGAYGGAITGGIIAGSLNPALIPSAMKIGAAAGGALGGIAGGRYAYKISKEATKGKIKDEDIAAKAQEIASNRAYAKQDFKTATLINILKKFETGCLKQEKLQKASKNSIKRLYLNMETTRPIFYGIE